MAETTNLLARLIIQNTKGMDGEAFQMLRSDVSVFLTRLQAKVMVGPRTGCDEDPKLHNETLSAHQLARDQRPQAIFSEPESDTNAKPIFSPGPQLQF